PWRRARRAPAAGGRRPWPADDRVRWSSHSASGVGNAGAGAMPQFRAVAASVTAKGGGVAMFRDDAGGERMTQRMRKLAGTVLLLLSIVVYSALAMAVYAWFLDGAA